MPHLRPLNGMLMMGGESVFIIHVPPPPSASFQGAGMPGGFQVAEQQVISLSPSAPAARSLCCRSSSAAPGSRLHCSWVTWATGLRASPPETNRCPGESHLPLGLDEVVGAPCRVKNERFLSLKSDCITLTSKRSLGVPRRTSRVRSWVHCSHWLHLLIAFTFPIAASLKGTGAKPNIYFHGNFLPASTSI